eukprot:bmy_21014T0
MLQPLFARCHAEVPPEQHCEWCVHDTRGTCQESQWLCGDDGSRGEGPVPGGAEGEAPCQESGHCVPHGWLCDYQDDRGDGSDKEGCATPGRGEGQMSCSSGHCLPLALICDGQDDCGDGTDEQGCPCPQDSLACADGRCLPPALLCNGHPDFPDAADEESCREVQGPPLNRLASNGNSWMRRESFWKTNRAAKSGSGWTWGGPGAGRGPEGPGGGAEPEAVEGPGGLQASPGAPPGWSAEAPAAPPCGPFDFASGGSGECAPRGWRCDGEEDCADGGDESGCDRPCAPHLPPCARGPLCVAPAPLCDGSDGDPGACEGQPVPGGPNRTGLPCPGYSYPDGLCLGFQLVRVGSRWCPQSGSRPDPIPSPGVRWAA